MNAGRSLKNLPAFRLDHWHKHMVAWLCPKKWKWFFVPSTSLPQNEVKIHNDEATLHFADRFCVYYPKKDSFFFHNEREFCLPCVKGDLTVISPAFLPSSILLTRN